MLSPRALLRTKTELKGYRLLIKRLLQTSSCVHNIQRSSIENIELPQGNLIATVFRNIQQWPNKTAVECSVTGERYSYMELWDASSRFGYALKGLGIGKGDIVAIISPNCPEYPIALYGAFMIGAAVTMVNATYMPGECARQLENSGASVIICHNSLDSIVDEALRMNQTHVPLITIGRSSLLHGVRNLIDIITDPTIAHAEIEPLSGTEVAVLPYSSGTTGPPKLASLTHNAITSNLTMFTHPAYYQYPETTNDHQLSIMCHLPFSDAYGLGPLNAYSLHKGHRLVTVPQFDPNTFVQTIQRYKIGVLHVVPPLIKFLAKSPLCDKDSFISVDRMVCGGATVSSSIVMSLKEKIDKDFFFQEGYGTTESLVTHMSPFGSTKLGTAGQPLPNVQAKVVDMLEGETQPQGVTGEILIKSPSVMLGYHKDLKATRDSLDVYGWIHTGDVGYYDEDGYLIIKDRTQDYIKVNTFHVAPSELEDLLHQHPLVEDVGVVGVPDEMAGQVPRAYIVTKDQPDKEMAVRDICNYVESQVSKHKQLAGGIVFIDELPRSKTGNLLRRELKKLCEK
ncbi:unnamed protein product [Meganyctiphanes norvegica]|uniref:Uncharacterized protein n=1 Tax=Meganyctiphanes norvegica TaxID=48144 RepID=A0AAV2RG92_MEGNR